MSQPESAPSFKPPAIARRRWKLRLLALCLGTVVSLGIMEVIFRVYVASRGWTANCYASHLQLMIPHPINGYEPRPGFELRSGAFHTAINSHGLRSEERSGDSPLIVTLGGSAAYGYLVSNEGTATAILERLCAEVGLDVDVQNGGVPGYNMHQSLVRFRERVAPLEPDYVLLYLGWNDLPYLVSDDPDAEVFHRGKAPPAIKRWLSYSTLYGFVSARLLAGETELLPPVTEELTPTEQGIARFRENLELLANEVREAGAELIVCCPLMVAHPEVEGELKEYLSTDPEQLGKLIALGEWLHEELEAFAEREGAIWIDAWQPPSAELLGDAIHLTAEGEHWLAELWFEELKVLGDE